MMTPIVFGLAFVVGLAPVPTAEPSDAPAVTFENQRNGLLIKIGGLPFASYVFEDGPTTRPFFKDIRTTEGIRITRNHPPIDGDPADHSTMHPGLWMAFGDINGADFWRNKARIRHLGFLDKPTWGPGRGEFAVRNRYEKDGESIAEELVRFTILPRPEGTLLLWDSTFQPEKKPITFGDQEEMGLGIRMATPLTVKHGKGQILNSNGQKNEPDVWGKPADWCAYEAPAGPDSELVGVILMPHPENFRKSWFHARNYGLLVANPFGRNAFTKEPKSQVTVEPGHTLRLRFGLLFFEGKPDHQAAYADYLDQSR